MVIPPFPRFLPPPKIAKDAAKASKRIGQELFQPIMPQTLTQLLDLPNMEVTHFYIEEQEGRQHLHLVGEHHQDVAVCPRCQQTATSGYDHKPRSVRHLDVFGMRTVIHFEKRRFDCEVCGTPFSELLSWIDPKRRQSRAYEEQVYEQVKKRPVNKWP